MTGPTDEFAIPPGSPIWTDAEPMPPDPVPGTCPHCGEVWSTIARRAQPGGAAVCQHCGGLLIADDGTWRPAYFDEAEAWDKDPRIKAMRAIWAKDDPGPGTDL